MNINEKDIIKYKLLNDSLFWNRYFFKKLYNRKFIVNDHHALLCDTVDRIYRGELTRLIINLPPRYTKTEIFVKGFISKGIALNPSSKYIHTTYSESLALDNSETARTIIKSEYYQELFNIELSKKSDSKSKWYTLNGGGVYATSSGGQITGFGAGAVDDEENNFAEFMHDIELMQEFNGAILIDDPIKPEDARSKVKRDAINQRFDNTIRSRTNSRNTPIIIIQQRVHDEDLSGYLLDLEPGIWEHIKLPALKDGKALWHMKHTVEELQHLSKINPYVFQTQYQQDTKNIRTGGEFLKSFSNKKHVRKLEYSNENTIHLSVDNNVYPYISISVWQVNDKHQKIIHEIPAREPNNSAKKSAKLVIEYLQSINYNSKIYLYGDKTADNKNTIDDDKRSFIDLFVAELSTKYFVGKRLNSKNPPVALTGEFVNAILEAEYDGIKFEIDQSCIEIIKDCNNTKEDADGKILKRKTTDSSTGITYEENGHWVDCIRYKLYYDHRESYNKFIDKDKKHEYSYGQQITDRKF